MKASKYEHTIAVAEEDQWKTTPTVTISIHGVGKTAESPAQVDAEGKEVQPARPATTVWSAESSAIVIREATSPRHVKAALAAAHRKIADELDKERIE